MNNNTYNFRIISIFLLLLLFIDFGFVLLHFYNSVLIPDEQFNYSFSLVDDSSFAEKFQYLKWLLIATLFLIISIKQSTFKYMAWALIFLYLLLDDSLEIHETFGAYLVQNSTSNAPFGLRMQDIGELLVTAIAGSILFSLLLWAYIKGNSVFKKITKEMLLLIAVLVLFGVGVDMLHQMFNVGRISNFLFEIVEDGGEMFIASIMLWYTFIVSKLNHGGIISFFQTFLQSLLSKRVEKPHLK